MNFLTGFLQLCLILNLVNISCEIEEHVNRINLFLSVAMRGKRPHQSVIFGILIVNIYTYDVDYVLLCVSRQTGVRIIIATKVMTVSDCDKL